MVEPRPRVIYRDVSITKNIGWYNADAFEI